MTTDNARSSAKSLRDPVKPIDCDRCHGEGTIRDEERRETTTCMRCGGTGKQKGS